MLNTQLIKSFSDMRLDPAGLSRLASDVGPVYILNRNTPTSVLLDVAEYEKLIEELQDARDGRWLKTNEKKFLRAKGISDKDIRTKYHLNS